MCPHVTPHSTPRCLNLPSVKAAGSSFYWALRLLPKDRREAMFRIYGFCRAVDDIADEPGDPAHKMARLESWRRDVESLYPPQEPSAQVACLKPVVDRYGLAKDDLLAVVDGMMTDATDRVRMADEAAFDLYLDRVACAVGRLSDRVFGISGETSERLAHHLGRALQITNILRDLREDAHRNRLYLPLSVLRAAGIESVEPDAVLAHPNLPAVLHGLAERAHAHFAEADHILKGIAPSQARAARVMKAVYIRLLFKLEVRGLNRIDVPVRVSKIEKLWLALRYGVL